MEAPSSRHINTLAQHKYAGATKGVESHLLIEFCRRFYGVRLSIPDFRPMCARLKPSLSFLHASRITAKCFCGASLPKFFCVFGLKLARFREVVLDPFRKIVDVGAAEGYTWLALRGCGPPQRYAFSKCRTSTKAPDVKSSRSKALPPELGTADRLTVTGDCEEMDI
jgi:hypothetical protein